MSTAMGVWLAPTQTMTLKGARARQWQFPDVVFVRIALRLLVQPIELAQTDN